MKSKPQLRLFVDAFWISPYSFSAFVALKEKGLPFETAELALDKGEHRSGDYGRRALTGKIPALEHGDFFLGESSAIIEYLEEAFPSPVYPRLLPADRIDRARARMVLSWIRCDMLALRDERPTTTMFYAPAERPLTSAGEAAASRLLTLADGLIPHNKTNLFGSWSIADSDLAFMLQRLVSNQHKVPTKVSRFVEAQWTRPSVRAFVDRVRQPYRPY